MKIGGLHIGAALAFMASAAITIAWCGAMSAMPGMEMPGGWTMGMAWMRMPGQGWAEYAGTFIGMWVVMMAAMMLPALTPMLARYRDALRTEQKSMLVAYVALAYFAVWTLSGVVLFAVGAALAEAAMRSPVLAAMVPTATAVVVLVAGLFQFTARKAQQLAHCNHSVDCCRDREAMPRAALAHGLKIGLRCVRCCSSWTAVLLVLGVMDVRAMALVTAAICAERLLPRGERAARITGVLLVIYGGVLLAA